jgi:hypothetical protein
MCRRASGARSPAAREANSMRKSRRRADAWHSQMPLLVIAREQRDAHTRQLNVVTSPLAESTRPIFHAYVPSAAPTLSARAKV